MIQVLDKKTLRRLEKRLRQEKKELEDRSLDSLGFEESLKESVQELSAYDNHPADLASETFEREKDLGIYLDNKRQKYNNIQDALERIKMGKYGICAICGRSIEVERLEVLPQAINCLDCQKMMEAEGQKADGDRPIEEIVLAYPFGRTFLRDTTEVAFDGEDTWQAVASYGTSESPQDLGGNVTYEEMYTAEPRGRVAMVENEQVTEEGLDEQVDDLS
ncbi:MAG TPA: conjugal transfer protein TraR [Firmicutes bacterium]|nr:conjugal transfer protein TraR [Bacillota bacterium]